MNRHSSILDFELTIDTDDGAQTVRVWVLEIGDAPTIYYDAPAKLAKPLLDGKPLQFTREGVTSTRIPKAQLADELPQAKADHSVQIALQPQFSSELLNWGLKQLRLELTTFLGI